MLYLNITYILLYVVLVVSPNACIPQSHSNTLQNMYVPPKDGFANQMKHPYFMISKDSGHTICEPINSIFIV